MKVQRSITPQQFIRMYHAGDMHNWASEQSFWLTVILIWWVVSGQKLLCGRHTRPQSIHAYKLKTQQQTANTTTTKTQPNTHINQTSNDNKNNNTPHTLKIQVIVAIWEKYT